MSVPRFFRKIGSLLCFWWLFKRVYGILVVDAIDIVKLNAEIKEIVAREQVLRDEIDKIIAEIEGGDA